MKIEMNPTREKTFQFFFLNKGKIMCRFLYLTGFDLSQENVYCIINALSRTERKGNEQQMKHEKNTQSKCYARNNHPYKCVNSELSSLQIVVINKEHTHTHTHTHQREERRVESGDNTHKIPFKFCSFLH
jgi:hypothetical protein